MTSRAYALAILLLFVAGFAFATEKPTPTPPASITSTTNSSASSMSSANASASSTSGASGTASNGLDFNGHTIVLPTAPFMPPMAPLPCPAAQIQQTDTSGGWGFIRHAQGTTDTRDCTAIIVINSLIERCQYGRAQLALDMLTARALPGFQVASVAYPDLTPSQCAALKAPAITPSVQIMTSPQCVTPTRTITRKPRPASIITECKR